MVDDHGPVVDPERQVRHPDVHRGHRRQPLEAPSEIVAEVTERPAAERQVRRRCDGIAEQLAQQLERLRGGGLGRAAARRDLGHRAARAQRDVRVRRQDVVAAAVNSAAAVEPNRPREIGDRAKTARDRIPVLELGDSRCVQRPSPCAACIGGGHRVAHPPRRRRVRSVRRTAAGTEAAVGKPEQTG